MFLALILVSTGAVTWIGYSGTRLAIRDLANGQINASLDSASTQVKGFFSPAARILFTPVRDLLQSGFVAKPGGGCRKVKVMFCDVESFTSAHGPR